MLDRILNIGCAFDWITPTIAFVQDFFEGPASDFGIPANAGWDRRDIKRLLTKHGIRVWGLMFNLNGDMLMFTVPRSQAKWAYHVLQRQGVPILYAPSEAVKPGTGRTSKKTKTMDWLDRIFNFFDN